MNRTIKFRGKRLDNGEWVCGSLLQLNDQSQIVNPDGNSLVDPETVGQFTGLKDRNGVDVFEGDIFKDSYYDWDNEMEIEYYITVKWDEPSYGFIVSQSDYHDEVEMHHLAYNDVIGNIYDNPELMEGD